MKSIYTCEMAMLDMADALESTLTDTQQILLADHISRCAPCRDVLPELATQHMTASLRDSVGAKRLVEQLIKHISRPVRVARGKGIKVQTEDSTMEPLPIEDSGATLAPPRN